MAHEHILDSKADPKNTHQDVLAFCYDFDKTLSPEDMQAQGYIQRLQENVQKFWNDSNTLALKHGMDPNLAYMYMMLKGAENNFYVKRDVLKRYGSKVKLYDGVDTWFDRMEQEGAKYNLKVEHYIISSGVKDMIEGTKIGKKFRMIYANTFLYNEGGAAVWPAQIINFTNKTQFLFRIEKGAIDVNDDNVNTFYKKSEMRVPFSNMIYIGDSATDIPCMKLVNSFGGHSIGVYDPTLNNKDKVYGLIRDERIKYFAPADYTEGSELELLVKKIIRYVAAGCDLRHENERYVKESEEHLGKKS